MTNFLRLTEDALRHTVMADALKGLARAAFRPGDYEFVWIHWLADNLGDLGAAAYALGVEVEDGPDFAERFKVAVMKKLKEGKSNGQVSQKAGCD